MDRPPDANSEATVWSSSRPLLILLFVGLLIRLMAGSAYRLTGEANVFLSVDHMIRNGTLIPNHFRYPTFYSYLMMGPTFLGGILFTVFGWLSSPYELSGLYHLWSILPLVPGRLVSTAMGVATIYLTYRIGQDVYGKTVGLLAGTIMTFSLIHVRRSALALPDATMVALVTLGLLWALRVLDGKDRRWLLGAGFFIGLGISAKYNGGLMLVPLGLVWLYKRYQQHGWSLRLFRPDGLFFPLIGSIASGFLIGSPGWLLVPRQYIDGLLYEIHHVHGGHFGLYHPPYLGLLRNFWTWDSTYLILFAVGLIGVLWEPRRESVILGALAVVSFLYIGTLDKQSLYFFLVAYPALAVLSARLTVRFWKRAADRTHRILVAGLFLLLITAPVAGSVGWSLAQLTTDTRWKAHRWIQTNVPPNSLILVDLPTNDYLPPLYNETAKGTMLDIYSEPIRNRIRPESTYRLRPIRFEAGWSGFKQGDYLITSSFTYRRFFTHAMPPEGHSQHDLFRRRRSVYRKLFGERLNGWKKVKQISGFKGPTLRIFRKVDKPREANLKDRNSSFSARISHPDKHS